VSTILNASGVFSTYLRRKVNRATSESHQSAEELESLNGTLHALRPPGLVDDLRQAEPTMLPCHTDSGEDLRRQYDLR
jgi:hypothetical protein